MLLGYIVSNKSKMPVTNQAGNQIQGVRNVINVDYIDFPEFHTKSDWHQGHWAASAT